MKLDVPFFGQAWDLEAWRLAGFESREDMASWQRSSCGVLCLQMALAYYRKAPRLKTLIDYGLELGAYKDETGWQHDGLIAIAQSYGLQAKRGNYPPAQLTALLEQRRLPLLSVKFAFRPKRSLKEWLQPWKKYGGHLALAIGYEGTQEQPTGFYVHHPWADAAFDWPAKLVPVRQFRQGYTGRAVLVWH